MLFLTILTLGETMKNKISSQIMFYFNMIIFSINLANLTYSSLVMNNDAKYSWLVPLFSIVPFLFLMLFFKKNFTDYQAIRNSFIFKFLIFIYSLLSITLIIYYSSVILTNWFYEESSIFLFIIGCSFIILLLSLFKMTSIIRVGFIWAIGYILLAGFGLTIHNESDIMFLFPIELKTSTFTKNLFFLIIPLDNLIYLFIKNPENNYPQKKTIIFSGLIALILCSIQLIVNLTLVNYRFYDGLETSAIETFFMYYSKNHIGHYDIVLIVNVLITLFYKGTLYANLAVQVFPKKKRILTIPFLSLIIVPIIIQMIYFKNLKLLISYINLGLIFFLYLFIIYQQRRVKNENCT